MSDWYQQVLTPPEVVEVRARFGLVPSVDHVQWLVEVVDPVSGILVGQWSMPHAAGARDAERAVDGFLERLRSVLFDQLTDTF